MCNARVRSYVYFLYMITKFGVFVYLCMFFDFYFYLADVFDFLSACIRMCVRMHKSRQSLQFAAGGVKLSKNTTEIPIFVSHMHIRMYYH